MQSFIISLVLLQIAIATFPNYHVIHFGLVGAYSIFKPNQPIFPNVVFWISFAMSDFNAIVKAIYVCETCEASKREPIWDCCHAVLKLADIVILNAFSIYIGWLRSRTSHKSSKDVDTAVLKRRVSKGHDIGIAMFLVFLVVLPLMVLVVDMNYSNVDLRRWTLNYLTYT